MNASGGPGDPAGAAVVVVGARGTVTAWSEGARLLLGHTSAQAVGRPAAEIFSPGPLVLDRAWHGQSAARHRDGHLLELDIQVSPALDGDAAACGCVITAAPEAADDAMVRWAFEQSSVSMSLYDDGLRHRRLNRLALGAMGDVPEESLRGTPYQEIVPEEAGRRGYGDHLRQVAETGRAMHYECYTRDPVSSRDFAWNTDMWPVRDPRGRVRGVAVAAFDSTAQFWARQRLALLNEAGAAIGTTLDVVRTADELAELAVPRLADFVSVDLLDSVLHGEEPPPGPVDTAVVLRRVAHRSRSDAPVAAVELGEVDTYPEFSPPARCLAEGRAVLSQAGNVDFSLWVAHNALRDAKVRRHGLHTVMAVPLMARGVTLGVALFARGTRPEGFIDDDMTLAEELAGRAAVCVDNARRFTREHGTALALQRSLLPGRLGDQPAVEVASRYLPAGSQAGVGGDWFDVVPLSGTRVALVVGDVVGHGIHASATMGRLRTAVRTLADVDLPPDELLTHLDDLVAHLNSEDDARGERGPGTSTEVGATCLYAVYDPISRRCSMASAGHPSPVLRLPDGTVEVVPVSAGPPLGIGGLPFEATERELPEGSVLALYTDGLIGSRDFDLDAGLERLRGALAAPAPTIESACDTILKSLPPDRPVDDVALLLARTRALNTAQVAVWDVPSDPAKVAETRQATAELLRCWGMEEAVPVTELVVSELVTNAIRHGSPPVQLRVIRDRSLICEVSDGSNTAPHLRRARSDDEGGRGLLLVAQLTQAWGTRQAATGKTIWAEQAL
ncbi:SpoIIE family protein phosphatase [Streptomyces sp. MI02-7b]|uniref:ATP-binding SpoIIE family protein phosphatase n=1 Tax=Streptomyces sp. MI02-7b TaxID=462941 RepID=UPI0029B0C14B|nr:SpoIIE family protein phosphatase [Streptomyces sp. MI02-7b]MDX3077587.1 SpoIIE family protein phosphatase [Streptomyces sp. MI02-7b]